MNAAAVALTVLGLAWLALLLYSWVQHQRDVKHDELSTGMKRLLRGRR